jgi:hypothetical protein
MEDTMEYGQDYAWIGLVLIVIGAGAAVYFYRSRLRATAEEALKDAKESADKFRDRTGV